jgi:UDP-N-acetylglucosamine acyltransferase
MSIHGTAVIHPSAFVEEGATVGRRSYIGPFAVIGPEVVLGAGVTVKSHAVITGWTELGDDCMVWPFATVGEVPQDLKYHGRTYPADRRRALPHPRGGDAEHRHRRRRRGHAGRRRCADHDRRHVGHDAQIGNRVILVNNVAIAGHCVLGDDVIVGGLSGVHQWVRIGQGAIIGAVTMVTNDVIPYGLVQAPRGELDGLNLVGLKRRGVDRAGITALRAAYQTLAQEDGSFLDRARKLAEESDNPLVREIADFILSKSDRSFLTPKGGR